MSKIRAFVEQFEPKTAVVIGGGFIGLEMAENLAGLGIKTTITQRSNHLLPRVDGDLASFIHANFRHNGAQSKRSPDDSDNTNSQGFCFTQLSIKLQNVKMQMLMYI